MTEFNAALQVLSTRRPGPGGPLLSEIQALALIGRGLAKRRLGDAQDSAKDLELAARLSSRTRQRAAVFFGVKD